jgi:hypothetical protein
MSQLNSPTGSSQEFLSVFDQNIADIKSMSKELTQLITKSIEQEQVDQLEYEVLQDLLDVIVQVYGKKYDDGQRLPIIELDSKITATTALVAASSFLKMRNLEIFELGMWQSWSGSK